MRKPIQYSLALIVLLISACNLPTKTLPGTFSPTKTAAPVILETQAAPTSVQQTPSPTKAAPTEAIPLIYDPATHDLYTVRPGDTLSAVAAHFGASPDEIFSSQPLPAQGLLPNHLALAVPRLSEPAPFSQFLLPDSEVVNSPCGRGFDIRKYVRDANGWLNSYAQDVDGNILTGVEVVKLVADNTSVNPHFLLAFIEFRSHWVLSSPPAPDTAHPLGLNIPDKPGLYYELSIYAQLLNLGYYAWRQGTITELAFANGGPVRISPFLNAGSVALQYLFARIYGSDPSSWEDALYGPEGFLADYQIMFGDPLTCSSTVEPLFPDGLQAPTLELPFAPGEPWALTGGLHEDWVSGTPLGALDFAPVTGEKGCLVSTAWALAAAPGIITRAENGAVQEALTDEAGKPTGWELLYMHVAEQDRVSVGTRVSTNERIGHPSCEGGAATGVNLHLARMYRGEWIGAGDPFPYVLSGWLAVPGENRYQSTLVKGDKVVVSNINGTSGSLIIR